MQLNPETVYLYFNDCVSSRIMKEEKEINLIWKRLADQDRTAFDIFYNTYYNPLFAYCLGKIKNVELAENAVSDVFIRIMQYENLGDIKTPENWVFTIAKNICLNHLNKSNRRNKILNDISWKFDQSEEQQMDQNIDVAYINSQIKKKLNADDHQIWKLHEQGFDNYEIAIKLDRKEKTIANRKVEIKKIVKKMVKVHLGINGK